MKDDRIRKIVRDGYAEIARKEQPCCAGKPAPCSCSASTNEEISRRIGYSEDDIGSVPVGANLGLGCGNPVALASLRKGETVLDLGSGAGFDCFLAASRVGKDGKVIGVDMTPEMIDKARENAKKGRYQNVEFRLGEIENLPVADSMVNVVISNCVINLSPDKKRVFEEAFRALKPEGRLMVSDIVLLKELPESIKKNAKAYVGCLSGAVMKGEYLKLIREAGFRDVKVIEESLFPIESMVNDPAVQVVVKALEIPAAEIEKIGNTVMSVKVSGTKPS